MEIIFRIRVCQMEYSSLSFLVRWSLGLSIGTLLPREKVVWFLQHSILDWLKKKKKLSILDWTRTGLPPYLLILWRGNKWTVVIQFDQFSYASKLLLHSRHYQNWGKYHGRSGLTFFYCWNDRWRKEVECHIYHQCCTKTWLFHFLVAWGHHGGKIAAGGLLTFWFVHFIAQTMTLS
jgi:hypothetical protein